MLILHYTQCCQNSEYDMGTGAVNVEVMFVVGCSRALIPLSAPTFIRGGANLIPQ